MLQIQPVDLLLTVSSGLCLQTSFMGRSVPALTLSRAASQMASRSYVFGKDDSNSAAPPTDGPGATAAVCSMLDYHLV